MSTSQNNLRLRPRFKKKISIPPKIVKERILKALDGNIENWGGKIVDNHVILKIPENQQHYWSPQLTLELEEHDGETLIRGLYGPKPGVWTMFVFFYSSVGFLTLMGLLFGLSQMMLKMDAYGLWSLPIGGSILIFLFILSKVGQRLSREQMHQLNSLLLDALKLPSTEFN